MSDAPEDVKAKLKHNFARNIEGFRQGDPMPIGGLVLQKDTNTRKLTVLCYSSRQFIENITQAEAQERIATAKEEVADLLSLFPELRSEIKDYSLVYHFCYDSGKAGVVMATEENNHFEYVSKCT
jgi:hypothetical protein